MATADRVLSVLGLFTIESPEWTVDAAANELGLSGSTAYQYVGSLVKAGLLVASGGGRYAVGPAIIELDRLTRRHDPLINAANEALQDIVAAADGEAIGLLCRLFRLKVMCVDQFMMNQPSFAISYERGRPMPLNRGAASKVILANLASRPLRRYIDHDPEAARDAGLGDSWEEIKAHCRDIRKQGMMMTKGELDPGMIGISAPVFGSEGDVVGSIGLVIAEGAGQQPDDLAALQEAVRLAGKKATNRLQNQ